MKCFSTVLTCPIFVLWHVFVFLATLIASVVIFARTMRWKRLQLEFRSPVVIEPGRLDKSKAGTAPDSVAGRHGADAQAGRSRNIAMHWRHDRSPRRSWVVEARALAWQTMKEGWKDVVSAGGDRTGFTRTVLPERRALIRIHDLARVDRASASAWWQGPVSLGWRTGHAPSGSSLTTGRGRVVWLVKLAVWGVGLAMIGGRPHGQN